MTKVERIRIYSHFTAGAFLHIEDALDLSQPKLRLFAGRFKSGQGMGQYQDHYLDLADGRVLFTDLAYGRPVNWHEFKGSERGGQLTAYRLQINSKQRGEETSVFIELNSGPGERSGPGIVKPVGKFGQSINVHLTGWDARRLGHAVLSYLNAFEVARMLASGRQLPPYPTSGDTDR